MAPQGAQVRKEVRYGFDGDASPVCQSHPNPELWFPDNQTSSKEAVALCFQCQFRTACLQQALEAPVAGVWGGTTANQREKIRRERRERHGRTA